MLQRLKKQKTKKRGAVVFRPGGWEDVQRGKPSYVFSVRIFNLIPSIVLPSTVYGCHGTFRRRSPLYACAVRKKKKGTDRGESTRSASTVREPDDGRQKIHPPLPTVHRTANDA